MWAVRSGYEMVVRKDIAMAGKKVAAKAGRRVAGWVVWKVELWVALWAGCSAASRVATKGAQLVDWKAVYLAV